MMSCHGLVSRDDVQLIVHKVAFKRGDPERKKKVLEMFSNGFRATAIVKVVGGTEASVRKIRDAEEKQKVAAQSGPGIPWYQSIADNKLEACSAAARNVGGNELPVMETTDLDKSFWNRFLVLEHREFTVTPSSLAQRE